MCFCLSTCQPSSADQRPPCFISSASPLCGCSFCPGCTQTTATCCRAPARRRRAPAHCWAEFLSTYQPAVLIEGCLAFTSSASPLKPQPKLLLEQYLSMSRVAMDILTFTALRAAPRITGDESSTRFVKGKVVHECKSESKNLQCNL